MTLEDVAGVIDVEDIGYTSKTVVFVSMVKKAYRESANFKNSSALGRIAQQIVNHQKAHPDSYTEQEWYSIWQTYRICKSKLNQQLGL
jgi:hypothetical protein